MAPPIITPSIATDYIAPLRAEFASGTDIAYYDSGVSVLRCRMHAFTTVAGASVVVQWSELVLLTGQTDGWC